MKTRLMSILGRGLLYIENLKISHLPSLQNHLTLLCCICMLDLLPMNQDICFIHTLAPAFWKGTFLVNVFPSLEHLNQITMVDFASVPPALEAMMLGYLLERGWGPEYMKLLKYTSYCQVRSCKIFRKNEHE